MPPIDVPWPDRNLVSEWMTMSAPHSNGRHRYGVARVLSTTSGMRRVVGDRGERLEVDDDAARVGQRLDEDRPWSGRRSRRATAAGSVASTKVDVQPSRGNVWRNWVSEPPYRLRAATKWSPGSSSV